MEAPGLFLLVVEDGSGGTGVSGEPVEVLVGKLFGGVAGGIDEAYRVFSVENRDSQRAGPAGIGAGLREASGTGHQEGGLGGAEPEFYGACVGARERARRVDAHCC